MSYADLYLPLQHGQVDVLMLLLPAPPSTCLTLAGIKLGPVLGRGVPVLLVPDSHPFAARPEVSWEDLADCQLLLPEERPPDWFVEAWHPSVTPGGQAIPRVGIPPTRRPDELFEADDPRIAEFLLVAAQTRLPLGHGKFQTGSAGGN